MIDRSKLCSVSLGTCWTRDAELRARGKMHDVDSVVKCPNDTEIIDICYVDKPWISMPSLARLKNLKSIITSESNILFTGTSIPPSVEYVDVSSNMPWKDTTPMKKKSNLKELVIHIEDETVLVDKDVQKIAMLVPGDVEIRLKNPDVVLVEYKDRREGSMQSFSKKASELRGMSKISCYFDPDEPPNMV